MGEITSIYNDLEYEDALNEISSFFDNPPMLESQEATRFESLLKLIEAYETANFEI